MSVRFHMPELDFMDFKDKQFNVDTSEVYNGEVDWPNVQYSSFDAGAIANF